MQVYKEHKQAHFVIMAGEKAIQYARKPEGVGVLSDVAVTLLLVDILYNP